ncbi:MAG: porin [Acidobacteria bacterium]|nr:porin [Acidobacteriota bacterium]
MKQTRLLVLVVLSAALGSAVLGVSPRVFAQNAGSQAPTVEERLQAIEQRLRDLERRLDAARPQIKENLTSSAVLTEATLDERFEALDQKVRILERRRELEQEAIAAQAKAAPVFGAGGDGFSLRSAEGDFQLKLRGYLQTDGRFFFGDEAQPVSDTFILRRIRPIFEGTVFKYFDFRIMSDFGGGQTVLQDAYIDARFWPQARFRVGKFKSPFGLERLQSATDLLFVERALPTNLVPNRDVGVQMHGDFGRGAFSYALGGFNGVVDGGSGDFDDRDGKDFVGRVFAHPFKPTKVELLKGLGLGVAGSVGNQKGSPTSPNLPGYKTTGQQTFFRYRSDGAAAGTSVADGERFRVSPQAYCYGGPFGLLTEYVFSSQEVKRGAATAQIDNESWHVAASYVLTGEKASYKGVTPRRAFDLGVGSFGAFEIAGRYSQLKVDNDAFPLFANPQTAARKAKAWAVGFNWYFNKYVKFVMNYEQTEFDGGRATGDRETEKAILSRFQIAF